MTSQLKIGLAQISPCWLQRDATVAKVAQWVRRAGEEGCDLAVFGESLVPGYPFWLEHTGGAKFDDDFQKSLFAHYLTEAVQIESGHLAPICEAAQAANTAVMVGCYERAADRGGHSGYCSLVTISKTGEIINVHRKVMPTYEERLVWGIGDGHGLKTFRAGAFTVGGLNCWENWLPLMRAALYGLGEDLHVAVWPGSPRNTEDITRFIAREGRSYVVSVSGLLAREEIPHDIPGAERIRAACPEQMASGGSCLASPTGEWLIEPLGSEETLATATLNHELVLRERQNLDVAGHYSRPDIAKLIINRRRQATVEFRD